MFIRNCRIAVMLLACVIGSVFHSNAAVSSWSASSGLWPSQLSTNWVYSGNSPATTPVIFNSSSNSYMVLNTAANSEVGYFSAPLSSLLMPSNLTIEFSARFSTRNLTTNSFSGMSVYFGFGSGLGNVFYIGKDDVWLANGMRVRGAGATVDTDDTFHTYRIELGGKTLGSSINVFYDNSPLLLGSVVSDTGLNGNNTRLGFGDSTIEDSGISKWDFLWHNASKVPVGVVPEPTTASLLVAAAALVTAVRRRK